MERKIGEIFEYNGEWYQCVKSDTYCEDCIFNWNKGLCNSIIGNCDGIIFKKLEKVGEPYEHCEKLYQCYKLPMETEIRLLPDNCYPIGRDNLVEIEIKENKEDMEGKKIQHYDCFFDGKSSKSNLKPFDLNAAKAGKPVCTRDGRKARIICFDAKGDKPIIALVEVGTAETPNNYPIDGKAVSAKEASCDLMMLSEKKEGWVNVAKEPLGDDEVVLGYIFNSYEDAVRSGKANERYVATVRIEWEG